MDIQDFLKLPYNIRTQVYFHLNGTFTNIQPPAIADLYDSKSIDLFDATKKKTVVERNYLDKLYPTFAPFIDIFEYNPEIVLQWLKYSLWLRYDAIVLDCLRLNHSYEGSLIGWLDWLDLRSDLNLAYFNSKGVLQTWYSQLEYSNWIIAREPLDISELEVSYLRLNMEYIRPSRISRVLESFEKKKLLNDIYEVRFETEADNPHNYDSIIPINAEEQAELQITDTTDTNQGLLSFDNAADASDDDDESRKKRKKKSSSPDNGLVLYDAGVSEVIGYLKKMKKLMKLSTRGDVLYDSLINGHGLRDRRNNAINYLVKRKIQDITLTRLTDLTNYGFSDLTKWDNLRKLSLINVSKCDMNMVILPKSCQTLQLRNIANLTWFNICEDDVGDMAISSTIDERSEISYSVSHLKHDARKYYQHRAKLWKILGSLNRITISHVEEITNKVVIPKTLYDDYRIRLFSCPKGTRILCI